MYYSTDIIFIIKWETRMGENINAQKILVEKPGRERPLGRTEHRSENNIEMDMRGRG
jgi:hypothetical protein